jgi:hypothetical protein
MGGADERGGAGNGAPGDGLAAVVNHVVGFLAGGHAHHALPIISARRFWLRSTATLTQQRHEHGPHCRMLFAADLHFPILFQFSRGKFRATQRSPERVRSDTNV